MNEIGDRELDPDNCVEIPHKYDLDLGKRLVSEFIETYLPNDYYRVENFFRRRGAYARYKAFLDSRRMLDKWYEFENQREEQALRQWCKENGIELSD